ncbi:NAD(+) synthase [Myxococcota bacterium]|nr:NAD(+) synthase [Myxococcota bacterium]MBU1380931.1 NAD(+) synthase [Myxococcota bacterium]MBU1498483.1 NAD(+) synthase [Myxococcota bacterium]
MDKIWNHIVHETKAFMDNAGFSKVVLGLSGGIDSALTACIACKALGSENVLAILMPSPYSSAGSITDSVELARNWGFETLEIPITSLMREFDASLEGLFAGTKVGIAEENIQARIRAVLLMAVANKQDRLLLNTCNKSEDYTGYATLYGDSCGAIGPIGGLYKTEVYALARWINSNPDLPDIPDAIINKPPSAELREGQLDTDSLPPYDILDAILIELIEKNADPAHMETRFNPSVVQKIVRLMKNSEFKRRQSPPVIEIERSFQ